MYMPTAMLFKNYFFALILLSATACKEDTKPNHTGNQAAAATDTAISGNLTTSEPAEPDGIPQNVEDIQRVYTATMEKLQQGQLDSTSFTYECQNEINGTVTYYSEGGKLRLMTHAYSEQDHHGAEDQYFVKDDKLFFTYTSTTFWSFDGGGEGSTKDDITEYRIYLVDDKPVKCLEKKYSIHSKATNNPKPDDVANKEVDCKTHQATAIKSFELLRKYRSKGTTGCLE